VANGEEIEVKFYLSDLPEMERRLVASGARLVQARVFERNLRFDTPDRSLTREHRVLRLRQDVRTRLTYKGPADPRATVSVRQEIEFTVDDFAAAWSLLEALGFEASMQYEKYRTTYHYEETEIVLDEMPYGNFLEIEGADAKTIQRAAARLSLNWKARSTASYMALFEHLRQSGLQAEYLTFALLAGKTFCGEDFGLIAADA
jgi:adenylate cyclase class 2